MGRRSRLDDDEGGFKDYYLMLQVHPEADAAMIDAAYWLLVQRYGVDRARDSSAQAKMDGLNEAYSVLRSSKRRVEYNKLRALVLGAGALPMPSGPSPDPTPLLVMERQRPRAREDVPAGVSGRAKARVWHLSIPMWQNLVTALLLFVLAVVALLWAKPAAVFVLVAMGAAVTLLPLLPRRPAFLTLPHLRLPRPGRRGRAAGPQRLPPLRFKPKAVATTQEGSAPARERGTGDQPRSASAATDAAPTRERAA